MLLFSLQLAGFNWIATRTNDFSEMPIHTNWSSKNNYKKLANEIDRKLTAKTYIRLYCEIGTIAYFSKNGIFLNEFTDRTEFLKLYRFLQLKNETANPIVSLFIRGMFYNIERIQEEYPMLEKYPLIILGNPPEKDKYELIGQTSSRWSSTWGLYLGKNP